MLASYKAKVMAAYGWVLNPLGPGEMLLAVMHCCMRIVV